MLTSPPPPPWRPKMNASFMRESPARNRKKILKGRNSTSSHNSQTITSSLISAPALTSRGLDCVPYWNDQVADWSRRLWLPTETGSTGSPSTSSNSSSTLIAQGSWFSQMTIQRMNGNYLRISSPLTPSSSADSKESDLLGKYYLFRLSFT
jgi:putative transposase